MPRIANVDDTSTSVHFRRVSCVAGFPTFTVFLLLFLSHIHGRPLLARWQNPCELPIHNLNPVLQFLGISEQETVDLCRNIIASTRVAYNQANKVLSNYVDDSFKDISFVEGTASHRLNWLPKVNPLDVEGMDLKEAIRHFYSVLQYFGVGLEQIITDQILYDGKYFSPFREVEDNMAQLLCTLQLGMNSLGVEPNPDVTRDVMRQQYRNIGSQSQRLIRNYLILRDYAQALQVMLTTFQTIGERTLLTTTPGVGFHEPKSYVTH